jgi:hypothetical protein
MPKTGSMYPGASGSGYNTNANKKNTGGSSSQGLFTKIGRKTKNSYKAYNSNYLFSVNGFASSNGGGTVGNGDGSAAQGEGGGGQPGDPTP